MAKIIAIANQKGGVAKTTTTANFAVAAASRRKRVLLIDVDAQGSLTEMLGFSPQELESKAKTLAHCLSRNTLLTDAGGSG